MVDKILCTICARGGSKGVKNKNIRMLVGKPLIAYTIEAANLTNIFDHVVVSTDSDDIAEVSLHYGAEVFFKRPAELATDEAAKLPVIKHVLLESEKYYNKTFQVIVDLDPTSPLRTVDDIKGALEFFYKHNYDNIITATQSRKSPYFNMVEFDENGKLILCKKLNKQIVRRQDAPPTYDMNASIYIWKRNALLNSNQIITDETGLYIMPPERSIDIDNEIDFKFVEFLMNGKSI